MVRIGTLPFVWHNEPMPGEADSLQVDLAEYNALRAEIQTLLTLQSAFLALAVAIIAAVIPVAASQEACVRPWIVAAIPLPFAILAILYADVVGRIGRAARYIQVTLRARLLKQTAPQDALGWEQYVHEDYPDKKLLLWTDKIRYAVFAGPAIVAYFASFRWAVPTRWDPYVKAVNAVAIAAASILVWRVEVAILREIVSEPKN